MLTTLSQTNVVLLEARLHQQVLEVATLRLALDIQNQRLAQTIPDFVWPEHRQTLPGIRLGPPSHRIRR